MISEKTAQFYNTLAKKQNSLTSEFSEYINCFKEKQNSLVSDFCEYLDEVLKKDGEVIARRNSVKKEYGFVDDEKFNILTEYNVLTDTSEKWKETIHSKLLCKILDPKTPVIGGKNNLIEFFRLIGLREDLIAEWDYESTFLENETTEKRLFDRFDNDYYSGEHKHEGIDILICDGKNCIIIENKITNAPNQANQLERYVQIVENQGLKIQKIVYMPPTRDKAPDKCGEDYEDEQKKIIKNDLLVKIPAVRSVADKGKIKSLAQDFFPTLMKEEFSESNKTRLVFFDQYKKIIAKLGENEVMKNMEKELVELLCGTPENQKRTNDLKELLDDEKFDELKLELLCEKLNKTYNFGFGNNVDFDYGKKLEYPEKTNADIYFYFNAGGYGLEVKSNGSKKQLLKDLMEKINNGVSNGKNYEEGDEDDWWWYGFSDDYDFNDKSIAELAEFLKNAFEEIQKAISK